jgi:hypothetical protein
MTQNPMLRVEVGARVRVQVKVCEVVLAKCAETEHKRNTHAPPFLMTPKVLSKLLDSRSI